MSARFPISSLLCLSLIVAIIDAQSGSLLPIVGQFQSLNDDTVFRMISEQDCVALCIRDQSAVCSGISYQSFRQECRISRTVIPSSVITNDSYASWRSFIHTRDVWFTRITNRRTFCASSFFISSIVPFQHRDVFNFRPKFSLFSSFFNLCINMMIDNWFKRFPFYSTKGYWAWCGNGIMSTSEWVLRSIKLTQKTVAWHLSSLS